MEYFYVALHISDKHYSIDSIENLIELDRRMICIGYRKYFFLSFKLLSNHILIHSLLSLEHMLH